MKRSSMKTKLAILIVAALSIPLANAAQSKNSRPASFTEKVLYNFVGGSGDGEFPWGGLVEDVNGNFYGTTITGGTNAGNPACPYTIGCGTVYKLDSTGKETVLHFFTGGSDGGGPAGALVLDSQGNLYGTTEGGGDPACQCGVVYKISSGSTLTTLYTFTDAPNPNEGPSGGLVIDKNGNLFGTTWVGGANQTGSIFEISANGAYTVLHSFNVWDGLWGYLEPLTIDAAGNLYGATTYGGAGGWGTAYKLTPSGQFTSLYGFTGGKDGGFPSGSVAVDSKGNLYGATYDGGSAPFNSGGWGVVYQLQPNGKYNAVYTFPNTLNTGGCGSYGSGVVLDKTGTLYGVTHCDGTSNAGSVFSINDNGESTVYSFTGASDGGNPIAPVMEDAKGNLYGTTWIGGSNGAGVVYELVRQ